jgi:outer membrane receptor protein involved in Fe transport
LTQDGKLNGILLDEKGKPVSFANLVLLKLPDSSLASSGLSNDAGIFSITAPAAGQYILRITAIGFKTVNTPFFEITSAAPSKDFGKMTLSTEAKTLQEVNVSALRPTITQLPDRMVVSIAGTAMAAGNTAYDVLGRSPGIFVDHEGNIQLNGRAGVTVMIDGKQTYLSARDLRTMLEGMSAENIRNIEIITNPSSRYEAEGLSGIININLKKNTQRGINGSVYAGINYNDHHWGHSFGANINHKAGEWNSFLSVDRLRRVGGREATFTRVFLNPGTTTYFDQVAVGNFYSQGPPSVRAGTDYTINSRHSIGGFINYMNNKGHNEFLTDTRIGNAPNQPQLYIDADNINSNTFTNFTANLHYVLKIDTLGSQLTADLDRIRITNRGEANFYNYYDSLYNNNDRKDFLYTTTPNGFTIYSGRLDYTKTLSHGRKFEAGTRASQVESDNDFRFYFNNNGLVLDPLRTNHFKYNENIYAAYLNYNTNLGKKTTLQAGLRMEHTRSIGNLITTGQVTKRQYTDLFPSIFIQQKLYDNYTITWSYGRRINRPNYGNLNPFRAYRDPYTYIEGNPYLRPQYSHSFSVTQTFKKIYILTLNYQLNKDFIAELPRLDVANATTIYYNGNVDGAYSLGATGIAPLKIMKKWDTQNTFVLSYNYNKMTVDHQLVVNDQLYYSIQSAHTIQLPKEIRMELSFLFQGPSAYGLYSIAPRSRIDIAFRKSFLKKKMEISLNAVDIFKGQRLKFETHINGNINDFDQYLRARFIGLTIRYNFSKGQKVDIRRRNTVDELNRT